MILMMLIMMMISINRFDHIAAACVDGVSATVFVVSLTDRFGSRLFLPSPTYMPQRGVGRGSSWVCQDLTEAITDHRHRVSDSPTMYFLFLLFLREFSGRIYQLLVRLRRTRSTRSRSKSASQVSDVLQIGLDHSLPFSSCEHGQSAARGGDARRVDLGMCVQLLVLSPLSEPL